MMGVFYYKINKALGPTDFEILLKSVVFSTFEVYVNPSVTGDLVLRTGD